MHGLPLSARCAGADLMWGSAQLAAAVVPAITSNVDVGVLGLCGLRDPGSCSHLGPRPCRAPS